MRRTARPPTRTGARAVTLAVALAATALTGCSSSDSSPTREQHSTGATAAPPPTAPPRPAAPPPRPHVDGHLDYTGSSNGGADFTGGVKCELKDGRLIGVTSGPDRSR